MSQPARGAVGERGRAAKRRVVVAALLACVLVAVALVWMMRSGQQSSAVPEAANPAYAQSDDESWTVPASDADVLLVWGPTPTTLRSDTLPVDRALTFDLAVPVSLDDPGVEWARIQTEGREPLALDGLVQGNDRNLVRLVVPGGYLVPGKYLVEVRTTEKNPLPLRRFALIVE